MTFPYDKKEIQERISPHYGEKGGEAVGRSFCVSCKKKSQKGGSPSTLVWRFCNVWVLMYESAFYLKSRKLSWKKKKNIF